jgi:2-dehydropantoate 2-reductase
MNIAILGCGSLGGVMAGRLAGLPEIRLTVLNRNPAIAAAVEKNGLILKEGRKRQTTAVTIKNEPESNERFDALILATKSNGLLEAVQRLEPHLSGDAAIITTQNGLVALDLEEVVGAGRLIPGVVLWGASMDGPGEYRITAHGPFIIGDLRGSISNPAVERAARLLSSIFPVIRSQNIRGVLWSKLAVTATLTTLGAVTGLRFGKLVAKRRIRSLILAVGGEVLEVSRSKGITVEQLNRAVDIERLFSENGYAGWMKHLLIRIVGWKHRKTESSLLDSLRRGRKTEIDFLNGTVVSTAVSLGIEVPYNRLLVDMVGEMERGEREPGMDNLALFRDL